MLYKRIATIAKKQGYSIRKIERICNFSNGTIRAWGINNNAPARKLKQVADLLNVTVDDLLKD
ncbi:helix-turn-helix domain-containing protein [Ligilactobacillus salivarius]|uniref:helix-turn-helix domain-containing protein n=1 Tax=Ligilactobacillus salivarius TaxID=1624 RepID=UPI00136C87A3|nr:helix-turn-helix domain-containing protein [Ligilactobacillus salivarius]MYU72637.1 helix-turn-helix transcriptional regulator [Ligilactobacillus salivarius]MYU84746.1 helix-turn-helix transcriptional regulator [Ligilactobacillus salivarius]MYU92158.1 helix-turn-helix transcriptional regulator [Ligilactobacillus salivarius]MYZ03096.1 helix-turn-helix transcriptional regulator [Ligilactobacillus salivarius]MYZ72188.1 helix-turn-helix transcriptional regulator [Ligilactobacillus salivarius]